MGYYTRFKLSTKGNIHPISEIAMYMKKKNKESGWFYPFSYDIDDCIFVTSATDFYFDLSEEAKWYDSDEEMKELSKQFPETVFCLYGEGEESGDTWYQYFKNGKSQYCPAKITYDEYDESKLA